MARQPIYDRKLSVYGYELLFRRNETDPQYAGDVSPAESAQSICNTLVEIGLDRLTNTRKAFINISEDLLTSGLLGVLPKEQVILEILESVRTTKETLAAAKELRAQGYTVALDDYTFAQDQEGFLSSVQLVKVDVMQVDPISKASALAKFRKAGITLLAEKVETQEMFEICRRLQFDYFQGYFFAKPSLVVSKGIPSNRTALITLIAQLQNPDVSYESLESLIASDLSISYRLLRLLNSASIGLVRSVDSIGQAMLFLGVDRVLALSTLLALAKVDDKPHELLVTSMVRGKMCEALAAQSGFDRPDTFFITGLLSVLDALLDTPMDQIVAELPLPEEVAQALVDPNATSKVAVVLQSVLAFEKGNWREAEIIELNPTQLNQSYLTAIDWAKNTEQELAA